MSFAEARLTSRLTDGGMGDSMAEELYRGLGNKGDGRKVSRWSRQGRLRSAVGTPLHNQALQSRLQVSIKYTRKIQEI